MTSGIQDYNDEDLFLHETRNIREIITPQKMWGFVNMTFACQPGECKMYSGTSIFGKEEIIVR